MAQSPWLQALLHVLSSCSAEASAFATASRSARTYLHAGRSTTAFLPPLSSSCGPCRPRSASACDLLLHRRPPAPHRNSWKYNVLHRPSVLEARSSQSYGRRRYSTFRAASDNAGDLTTDTDTDTDTDIDSTASIISDKDGTDEVDANDSQPISCQIRMAYDESDTDGILSLCPSLLTQCTAPELIAAVQEAANNKPGVMASMLNGLLGGCVRLALPSSDELLNDKGENAAEKESTTTEDQSDVDAHTGSQYAYHIITEWLLQYQSQMLSASPDLVSYCLAYTALSSSSSTDDIYSDAAVVADQMEEMLDNSRRWAKKRGGSKYRKAVNAAKRRRGTAVNARDVEESLQQRYGEELRILYEDEEMVVVNKPSGMVCYHRKSTTKGNIGRGKHNVNTKKKKKETNGTKANSKRADKTQRDKREADISLIDILSDANISLSTLNPEALGIVHRIDRGTSGCLILAKSDEAHARLVSSFFCRRISKSYDALIPAHPVLPVVEAATEGEGGEYGPILPDVGMMTGRVDDKSAKSTYEVVQRLGDEAIRIRVRTMTGRKHQVRVHCAQLGRPLFLDDLYGNGSSACKNKDKEAGTKVPWAMQQLISDVEENGKRQRFFLHAASLELDDGRGKRVRVEAPIPRWWRDVEARLLGAVDVHADQ